MENSEKNFQGKSFKTQNLAGADFSGADIRGANFTGAILTNANFSHSKTGLKKASTVLVFLLSLTISLISGYFAMLTGATVQLMLNSPATAPAGYTATGLIVLFIILALWKGGRNMLVSVIVTIAVVLICGLTFWLSGAGTGLGALYTSLALVLFVFMIIAGTIARTAAGTLSSNVIFLIVAVGGGMFGKSLGGGIGTVVLAISCALISKRILSGKADFANVRRIALKIGSFPGTSFKNADLTGANFSNTEIKNSNLSGAKLIGVNWNNSVRKFTLEDAGPRG